MGSSFLASSDLGPGVRLVANAPNGLRPMKLGRFDSMMVTVEWRGRQVEVFIRAGGLDDLGSFHGSRPEVDYAVALFDTAEPASSRPPLRRSTRAGSQIEQVHL